MFGSSKVESAPYKTISRDETQNIEVREYNNMILASTPMTSEGSENSAFRVLFKYITGDNIDQSKIAMTAPVFMDEEKAQDVSKEIPMTAPVFMDDESAETPMMSFVMPVGFTLETTPKPTNPLVRISEVNNYQVATIQFSGRLSDKNVDKHREILENWIKNSEYKVVGNYQRAGYNAPFTLPALRRNEVLIPVAKK